MTGEMACLNLVHPNHGTIKSLIGLLAAIKWPDSKPCPEQLYAMVLDRKAALDQYDVNTTSTYLVEFPWDPHYLPDDMKARAYNNDLSTVTQHTLAKYEEYVSLVIVRGQHKLLRNAETFVPDDAPAHACPPKSHTLLAANMGLGTCTSASSHHVPQQGTSEATLLGQVLDRISRLESKQVPLSFGTRSDNNAHVAAFNAGAKPSGSNSSAIKRPVTDAVASGGELDAKDEEDDDEHGSDDEAAADCKVGAYEHLVLGSSKGKGGKKT